MQPVNTLKPGYAYSWVLHKLTGIILPDPTKPAFSKKSISLLKLCSIWFVQSGLESLWAALAILFVKCVVLFLHRKNPMWMNEWIICTSCPIIYIFFSYVITESFFGWILCHHRCYQAAVHDVEPESSSQHDVVIDHNADQYFGIFFFSLTLCQAKFKNSIFKAKHF